MKKKQIIDVEEDRNLIRHKRRLHFLRTRRNLRQMEINIHRSRVLAKFFLVIFLMWLIFRIANLHYWYLNPAVLSYYPNHTLEIQGNSIVSTKQIMEKIKGIKIPHKPIYMLNTLPIEKSIMTLSPVKKVYVRRFWFPARLNIVIVEKQSVLAISPSTKAPPIAVFADDSTIIGKDFLPLPASQKAFTIITNDDYTKWNASNVKNIVHLAQILEANSKENLVYLDIRNPDDVYAQLTNVSLRLGELDSSMFRRAQRIGSVLTEALKIKDNISYIDLRWDNSNSVSIKLKK